MARRGPRPAAPAFVLALADGLTTSYRSESAAALACWVPSVPWSNRPPQPAAGELARLAFDQAGLTIGRPVDEFARDPETSPARTASSFPPGNTS